ncbi:MAG: hypothetical protein M3394_00975 [Actinomycetota bacterium]|nr:hypothetical protein [Actinomycetota bacterium]
MKRLIRLAAVAAGLLGMLGTTVQPAHATNVWAGAFVGTATLSGGLGYPVITLPVTPLPELMCNLPLNGLVTSAIPNCHLHNPDQSHQRNVSASATVCVGLSVNILKAEPPVSGPLCSFFVAGYVTGHCGLSGGQVGGTVTIGGNTYRVSVHFTGVGGTLVLIGHWTNAADPSHHGLLVGVTLAVPVPTVTTDPPGLGNSCTQKTASVFNLVGLVAGVPEPVL